MNNLTDINGILNSLNSFAVFKNIFNDEIIAKFMMFLDSVKSGAEFSENIESYSEFASQLYSSEFTGDWSSYVRNFVLTDENVVSVNCARNSSDKIPDFIMGAFEYELRILSDVASVSYEDVREILKTRFPSNADAINSLPVFDSYKLLFTKDQIQTNYKTEGYGVISRHYAFKYDKDLTVKPVLYPDDIRFSDLKSYEYQKEILITNTLSFIKGRPANNILLYGDRGCGKSSSIKALVNEYHQLGLKVIQAYKENLDTLEDLEEYLSGFPSKFIIFIDDLVFDENDPDFASAKAILEGSLSKHPDNVLIYATTNRRHLVKETFSSREGNEIHLNDTMDEAASLSDRFGITITFSSPDKNKYLEIVKQIAAEMNINEDEKKLFKEAEAFAILKGTRCPRVARQFLADYASRILS